MDRMNIPKKKKENKSNTRTTRSTRKTPIEKTGKDGYYRGEVLRVGKKHHKAAKLAALENDMTLKEYIEFLIEQANKEKF